MKTAFWVSVFAVGLWTLVAAAQEATSVAKSSSHALKLSVTEQAVWEQEEAYWQFVKTDNRQKYLDLWDDRFVGWPRLENNPIHKDDITRFMLERKVLGLQTGILVRPTIRRKCSHHPVSRNRSQ